MSVLFMRLRNLLKQRTINQKLSTKAFEPPSDLNVRYADFRDVTTEGQANKFTKLNSAVEIAELLFLTGD